MRTNMRMSSRLLILLPFMMLLSFVQSLTRVGGWKAGVNIEEGGTSKEEFILKGTAVVTSETPAREALYVPRCTQLIIPHN